MCRCLWQKNKSWDTKLESHPARLPSCSLLSSKPRLLTIASPSFVLPGPKMSRRNLAFVPLLVSRAAASFGACQGTEVNNTIPHTCSGVQLPAGLVASKVNADIQTPEDCANFCGYGSGFADLGSNGVAGTHTCNCYSEDPSTLTFASGSMSDVIIDLTVSSSTSSVETSTTSTPTSTAGPQTTTHHIAMTTTSTIRSLTPSSTPSATLSCPQSAGQTYVGPYNHFSYTILCPGIDGVPAGKRGEGLSPAAASAGFETCIGACDATENCQSAVFNPTSGSCYTYNCAQLPLKGTWGAEKKGATGKCPAGVCPSDIEKASHSWPKGSSEKGQKCTVDLDSGIKVDYQDVGCGGVSSHMINVPGQPADCSCAVPPPSPPPPKDHPLPAPPSKSGSWAPADNSKPSGAPGGGSSDSGNKGGSAPAPTSTSKADAVGVSGAERFTPAIGMALPFVFMSLFL
ncbi:hypothetical protein BX600DRAFT_526225 [Xylariales sp. PMI_506]|nr:hypothetical protein BX600DRAFT_526225 [Xylariales sp. PMI_506]